MLNTGRWRFRTVKAVTGHNRPVEERLCPVGDAENQPLVVERGRSSAQPFAATQELQRKFGIEPFDLR